MKNAASWNAASWNAPSWNELSQQSDQDILAWAANQPWAVTMADCQQDPGWHAEGDVWTHTLMVCDQLFQLPVWPELSRDTQLKLLLTAIFHDSGKPATTYLDEETGRIRSPKHAQHGMRIARRCLIELGCDVETRESICHLILFHGRPPYLAKQAKPAFELIKLSTYVDHRLLYLFAIADTRGRICESDGAHTEEILELWRLVAEENRCWKHPFEFASDHTRFLFHRGQIDNLHYQPHHDFRCKMTVMCGLPGAGKNTWLQKNMPDMPVVSLDAIRKELKIEPTDNQGVAVQTARQRCREYLRDRTDFALNATNTTRQVRKLWIDLGADYDAKVSVVYVEPNIQLLLEQNSGRDARVPEKVIQRLVDKLDPPTLAESHELLFAAT